MRFTATAAAHQRGASHAMAGPLVEAGRAMSSPWTEAIDVKSQGSTMEHYRSR